MGHLSLLDIEISKIIVLGDPMRLCKLLAFFCVLSSGIWLLAADVLIKKAPKQQPFCDVGSGFPGWEARFLPITEHAIRSHPTVTGITSRLSFPAENEIDNHGQDRNPGKEGV